MEDPKTSQFFKTNEDNKKNVFFKPIKTTQPGILKPTLQKKLNNIGLIKYDII